MTVIQLSNFNERTLRGVRYFFRVCFIIKGEYRTHKGLAYGTYLKESHKVIKDLDVSN